MRWKISFKFNWRHKSAGIRRRFLRKAGQSGKRGRFRLSFFSNLKQNHYGNLLRKIKCELPRRVRHLSRARHLKHQLKNFVNVNATAISHKYINCIWLKAVINTPIWILQWFKLKFKHLKKRRYVNRLLFKLWKF